MKRYGDNLPSTDTEDELAYEHGRNIKVMYGGCGVRFGTFPGPANMLQNVIPWICWYSLHSSETK